MIEICRCGGAICAHGACVRCQGCRACGASGEDYYRDRLERYKEDGEYEDYFPSGDFDIEDDFDGDWLDDEENFDCGAMYSIGKNGKPHLEGCGKVGSEECDFECPFRAEIEAEMERQAKRKRA